MIAKYNESNGTMKGYSGLLEEPYNIKETIEIYFDLLLLINASGRGPGLGYGYPGDDKSSPVYQREWDWQMELLSRFHLVFAHYAKFRMGFYGSENTRLLQSSSYTGDRNLFIGSNNYDYGIINNTGGILDEVIQHGEECQSQMFPHFKPVVYEAVAKACRRFVELARTLKPLEEKRQYILAQENCQDLNPDTCPEYFEARDAVHDYGESEFRSILKELWDTIPGGTQEVAPEAGSAAVGSAFRDCGECPEMVVVPAGNFMMGSPSSEGGRGDDEGPMRRVTIGYPFAVGVYEVTRGEFAHFVEATGRSIGNVCWTYEGGEWKKRSGRHWRHPGFGQTDAHPVVCVDWEDARAYVRWLSEKTGEAYRLLSEAEWEYVARAGTTGPYHFGSSLSSSQANYGKNRGGTVPVGSYSANAFGLHDVHGNVWEWVADCWNGSYAGAPSDGSAWESGHCSRRVLRGGSWVDGPGFLRSAFRGRLDSGNRNHFDGFRVARTLAP